MATSDQRAVPARLRRVLAWLRADQAGSLAASAVFVVFASLSTLAVMTMVISTVSTQAATSRAAAVNDAMALEASDAITELRVRDQITPLGSSTCTGDSCATAAGEGAAIRLTGTNPLLVDDVEQYVNVWDFEANYIAGFDASGDAVWVDQTGTEPHRFTSLVSAGDRTCGLQAGDPDDPGYGTAWCWGPNNNAQLGTGDRRDSYEPIRVASPDPADDAATVTFSTLFRGTDFGVCGLQDGTDGPATEGTVWCWGANDNGRFGVGAAYTDQLVTRPVEPLGGLRFTDIAQSATTTCGITATNAAWCWGQNTGSGVASADGDFASAEPVEVAGGHQFTKIAMDTTTAVALDTAGKLWAWTPNSLGQPGTPGAGVIEPAAFSGMGGVGAILSAAVRPASQPGLTNDPSVPVEVYTALSFKDVVVAPDESGTVKSVVCAIAADDTAWCWGEGTSGQLGNGDFDDSDTPVAVAGGYRFAELAPSSSEVCGRTLDGQVYCWGSNSYGQLGNGTTTSSATPVLAAAPAATVRYTDLEVATGDKHGFCAVSTTGGVDCWGRNTSEQAEPGTVGAGINVPRPVAGVRDVAELSMGDETVCAATTTGITRCWGRNVLGQTGIGTASLLEAPQPVAAKPHRYDTFTGYLYGGQK